MPRLVLLALLLLPILVLARPQGEVPAESDPRVSVTEPFPLVGWPDGDAAAGRTAFKILRCTDCHSVPSIPELRGDGKRPGPALVGHDPPRSRLLLVRQIVAPGTDQPDQETHMRNYADVMTVQQLTDLVAFLESLEVRAKGEGDS